MTKAKDKKSNNTLRRFLTTFMVLVLIGTLSMVLFGCKKDNASEDEGKNKEVEKVACYNPMTGLDGFREEAIGKRPVSIVVENQPDARPQWGIGSADIVFEGEVEGGVSRMLWMYADYEAVPDKVGPIRSARPPYVKLSKMFDAIFIHWGGSHDNSGYIGGYTTIANEGVDDIDGMNGGKTFGRDKTRDVAVEHRGIVNGNQIAATIEEKAYRNTTDENNFKTFSFNKEMDAAGPDAADKLDVKFSRATDTRNFVYNKDDKAYHTEDWIDDVSFTNVFVIKTNADYITVPYKGGSTTYVNYAYNGGEGYYASCGTVKKMNWSIEDGKLVFTDENGEAIKANVGKSYVALTASNNGGNLEYGAEK